MRKEIKKYPNSESFCYNTKEAIEYNKNKDEKLIFDFKYLDTKWKIDFNLLLNQPGLEKELVGKVEELIPMTDREKFFKDPKKFTEKGSKLWRNDYTSQLIEGINRKNYDTQQLRVFFNCLILSKVYLIKTNKLNIRKFPAAYILITNNQKLVDGKWNEILDRGSLFRKKDIFINNKKSEIGPDAIEPNLQELCELFNDVEQFGFVNNDPIVNDKDFWLNQEIVKTLYPAVIIHFFFEYIHPFPDFNGRLGRIIYDEFIKRNFKGLEDFKNIFLASEAINASKNEYYNAIKQTENSRDLTYMLIYYHGIVINNLEKFAFERSNQKKISETSEHQRLILFNIFMNKSPISASEYIEKFDYDRTKQQLHHQLNKLDELDLLDYQEHKNRIRRYYIKK